MSTQEIMNLIEDALELEQNSLSEATELAEISEYDSMGKLSLIILSDDEFGKTLSGERIREFKTVGDVVRFLSAD